jgi:hypothetical protein
MTKVSAFGSMARYACDLAAGESANAAASALSEKLVDPGRNAGAVIGTHSAADDAVVAECRLHGKATFAGRGDINILVVVVHREMRPRGHSCLCNCPCSVGHRPNAKLGGLPGRRLIGGQSVAGGRRAADNAVVAKRRFQLRVFAILARAPLFKVPSC